MCECILISDSTGKALDIAIADEPNKFIYRRDGVEHVLLDDISMLGKIDHAACYEIANQYGFKRGYMFILGEAE